METMGMHLLVEFMGCDPVMLNDSSQVGRIMHNAATAAGCNILGMNVREFNPQGVTAYILVAESHLSIHTWPEHGYAAIDIFTCGNHVMPYKAYKYLKHKFKPETRKVHKILRGIHT